LAFDDQKSKEHANSRRTPFRRGPPAASTFFQDKLSQAPSIKPARLVSQASEQLANGDAVVIEGPITRAALLAHPPTECRQENRLVNGDFAHSGRDDASLPQMSQEQACALEHVQAVSVAIARASASTKVAVETRERLLGQTANRFPPSLCPIDEVFRRSDVSAGRDLCVARSGQLVCKPFKQPPGRASTKFANPHR
jgi:hypothetical protein